MKIRIRFLLLAILTLFVLSVAAPAWASLYLPDGYQGVCETTLGGDPGPLGDDGYFLCST